MDAGVERPGIRTQDTDSPERDARGKAIFGALLAGAFLIATQSAAHLIVTVGLGACDATGFSPCPSTFDLDHNNGVSDVVSTIMIGVAAAGAAALGVTRRPRDLRALSLGAVLTVIAVDDALHLEDNFGSVDGVVVLGTIVIAALLTILVATSAPRGSRWLLLVGICVLAVDAKMPFAYDHLMNTIGQPALVRGDLLYELGVVLDEALELSGWILLAVGLWDAALSSRDPVPYESRHEATRAVRPRHGSSTQVAESEDGARAATAQLGVGTTSPTSASRATSDA